MRMRTLLLTVTFVTAAALVGCGSGGTAVDGKVVHGDKAYSPAESGDMTIILGGEKSYSTQVKPDGTFKFEDAGGVAAGKYSVSVTKYPTKAEMEKLKGPPMPTTKETGESWDVSGVTKSFTLDVSKVGAKSK